MSSAIGPDPDPQLAAAALDDLADRLEAAHDRGDPLPADVVWEVLRRARSHEGRYPGTAIPQR